VTLLGGGFGRKSKPDYVGRSGSSLEESRPSGKSGLDAEDDIKFDYFNAVAAMYMSALDAKGRPTAWLQRSVFSSHYIYF